MSLNTINRVTVVTLTTHPADPTARREHVAVTADVAAALDLPVPLAGRRRQVRIAVTGPEGVAGNNAVFTVADVLPGGNQVALYPSTSTLAENGGVYKLFGSNALPSGVRATLYNQAPSSTTLDGAFFGGNFTEPAGAGRSCKEFVATGGGELAILAPHGGGIEEETSAQLAILRRRLRAVGHDPAVWDAQGLWGGGQAFRRWHVASVDVAPESFPGLGHLVARYGRFPHAAALHGFAWEAERVAEADSWRSGIVVGGRAPVADKQAVVQEISRLVGPGKVSFVIADPAGDTDYADGPDGSLMACSKYTELRGVAAGDLVNVLSPAGGIYLAQSVGVREVYGAQVAIGLARALDRILSRSLAAAPVAGASEPELATCSCLA